MATLTDEEVFGPAELTDDQVFGPTEMTDAQVGINGISDRAGNAAMAGAQGVVTSTGQSISGLARTADTIQSGALLTSVPPGTAKPTLRQSRRAFEQSMNDPRYMTALTEAGDDPAMLAQAEQFFGPKAKLDAIRTPIDEGRKAAAQESAAQQKRLEQDSPMYAFGKGLVDAGKEVYPTDPYLDTKFESKVTRSLGSTVPSVALGMVPGGMPAAVSQYALSQSEDMAQEALDAGRPDLAMQAATAGLFIGALSEATLGATARLRSILKNPTSVKALEGWAKANPIKATALIAGVREAGQEGVEQTLQNKTASSVVGYDPERPWHRQVLESMVLGGIGGGIFGGGGALLRKATTPKAKATEEESLAELNAALDDLQKPGERVTELQVEPPAVQGTQGELIPLPQEQPEILTAAQKMSREAVNAMAELRALKEQAKKVEELKGEELKGQATAPVEERPAQTIEAPQSPATQSPAVNVGKATEMPAETGVSPAPEKTFKTPKEWAATLPDEGAILRMPNITDAPFSGAFKPGELSADRFGDDPFIYQAQWIDPKILLEHLKLEGMTYEQVVKMPSTQRYIEWYQQGNTPPPITVVFNEPLGKLYSSNRRRVVAAIEAGVEVIPANVELGKASKLWPGSEKTVARPAPRRRPKLGPRADGVGDVLDDIADLGGIKAPGSQKGTAEYDGYAAAFNEGGPTSALRGGSNRPDLLLQQLQAKGYRYESIDDMYQAAQRAGQARDALTAQLKAERRVRPEMVERVQALYDAAKQGVTLAPETLAEIESQLNQKELRALKGPLEELIHLANVAVAEPTDTTPIAKAKAEVREAWQAMQQLGIMADPKRDAEKAFALYKALFKLAVVATKQGIRTAEDFAAKYGVKMSAIVRSAWQDAQDGKAKTAALQLAPGAVTELVDDMRERKFSQRFAEDDRMAPEVRAATGNAKYQPISNLTTVSQALAEITDQGIDAAINRMKDLQDRTLSDRERVAIGQAIIAKLNHQYQATKTEAVLDKAVDVAEWLTEYGTTLGQGVQAFAIWSRMTPEGYVRAYVKAVKQSQRPAGPGAPQAPPTADPAVKRKIHAAAAQALNKPAGFQRDEALIDVLAQIARAKGVSKLDLATALWYANILSGYPSWIRNAAGNVGFLFAESITHATTRPQHIPAILTGLFKGFGHGVPQAVNVLRTGKQTGARVGKVVEAPRVLELVSFGRPGGLEGVLPPGSARRLFETAPFQVLNAFKYVFRIMAATDAVAFESAQEMHARFIARELVRTGKADGRNYAQLLAADASKREAAGQQAEAEGLTGINYQRRMAEIIREQRPDALNGLAAQYGLYATFNQQPHGVLGAVARQIGQIAQRFAPFRTVIPFTNIVANVFNNTLDYSPWGYRRLFPSVFLRNAQGRTEHWMGEEAAPVDYQLQAARATLGTVGLAALWALSQAHKDDDDPAFDVSGNGPASTVEREGLKEAGWRPYSVKIGGVWFNYAQAPIAPGLAWIGFLRDAQRTKRWINMDEWSRFAYAGKAMAPALLSQSFVSGLRDFLQDLSDDGVDANGPKFRWASRTASTVVPAMVKAVDKAADPTIYDSAQFPQALLRDIPYARSEYLKPALNALGEPLQPPGTFYSVANPDPLWALLAAKQALPGKPSLSQTMVGNRPITPEEYYNLIEVRGQWLAQQLRRPEMMALLASKPPEQAQRYVQTYAEAGTKYARAKLKLRPASPK